MTIEEIKELVRIVNESGVAELEVQRGDNRVRVRRNIISPSQEIVLPTVMPVPSVPSGIAAMPVAPPPPAITAAPPDPPAKLNAVATPVEDENTVPVKSPIVGTYYDAPSPSAPPFVKVGDRVEPRQVLCIIESMKLMNEIEAEIAGTVVAKLVENGRPVEYGQTLFTIRPH